MAARNHAENIQKLTDAILTSSGDTDPALRRSVEEYSYELAGLAIERSGIVPRELDGYVRKITSHAYKTTDEDIKVLREAGYSEDALFEITLSAALGAGLARLESGLAALKGGSSCD